MIIRLNSRYVAGMLGLMLIVPGCGKKKPPAPEAETPPAKQVSMSAPGAGPAVMAAMPAVGRAVTGNELKQFAIAYLDQAQNGPPPKSLEEMKDFQREAPKVCQAIKDGDLIVFWGADPKSAPAGASNTILAHAKTPTIRTGPMSCAFLDGSVRPLHQFEIDKTAKGK